jgi:CheY-like chemotaxis protein
LECPAFAGILEGPGAEVMNDQFGTTILLVEDNEDDVFAMRRALKLAGVSSPLQVVTNGRQAIDYLSGAGEYGDRRNFPPPFLIFLDLRLPGLSGFEVLGWIRRQPPLSRAVVIVVSSSEEERDHERAYALGARSYLVKPPTPDRLRDIFDSLDSYWLSRADSGPAQQSRKPPPRQRRRTTARAAGPPPTSPGRSRARRKKFVRARL